MCGRPLFLGVQSPIPPLDMKALRKDPEQKVSGDRADAGVGEVEEQNIGECI